MSDSVKRDAIRGRALLAAGLVLATGLAGCSKAPAPRATAAPPPLPSEVVVLPTLPTYVCPNGRLVEISEDKVTDMISLSDGSTQMQAFKAADASRTRFVNGELTITYTADALGIESGKTRKLVCPRRPAAPTAGQVWGMLEKRDRMALASGTRARVMIVDVSRADAPAEELASTTIETNGNQVPLAFLVRFDPQRIQPGRTYGLTARIEGPGGDLLYITDTHTGLFAQGVAEPAQTLNLVPARP